ncbi:histidine phosphatase family protein [Streptococcus halotolerans]|uniref:histidine phosphatase family protein n=1 Tax=Streptococcus halotolerans TaxID=1814128 RepID=UPI000787600B|nr:histidine phosphatase family protein [Streptococcus halotolerans]
MTKTLYLMRHGQTRFNELKRIQGVSDSPLTPLGIQQATKARAYFQKLGVELTAVYSSTQERAVDTAEIVSGSTDIVRLKGLKEMDFGTFEGQSETLNPPLIPGIGYADYFVQHGGEDSLAVRQRVGDTVRDLLANHADGDTILVVSHGAAIAQFYRGVLENPPQVRMRNCAILAFEVEDNNFRLDYIYDPVNESMLYENTAAIS